MTDCQVAVIGAGIAGSLIAIQLADTGVDVILVDRNVGPVQGASRWNEGKIHLGYCYLGDPTFASANLMLDGAACFIDEIERLIGHELEDDSFSQPFIYLVDPDTQFPIHSLWHRSQQLAALLKERAATDIGLRRFTDNQTALRKLDPPTASAVTGTSRVAAAWETSELAVNPRTVAKLIQNAVMEREIPFVQGTVKSISQDDLHWRIKTGDLQLSSQAVVNAAWESRKALDRGVTGKIEPCSIRYKYAIFGRDLAPVMNLVPSTRIVGQFGDITTYRNGETYLSWYPAALAGLTNNGISPILPPPDHEMIARSILDGLGLDPSLLATGIGSWELKGGYVVAHGHGDIDHSGSPLHSRSHPGVYELAPGYVSVDTGKYSLGPLMARQVAHPSFRKFLVA